MPKKITHWRKYFDHIRRGWMIKEESFNQTPIVFMPEPLGGTVNDEGLNKANADAATVVTLAPAMLHCIRVLDSSFKEHGCAGCTYGDTDFDSLSVVYGYNMAIDYLRGEIAPIIEETKHIGQ